MKKTVRIPRDEFIEMNRILEALAVMLDESSAGSLIRENRSGEDTFALARVRGVAEVLHHNTAYFQKKYVKKDSLEKLIDRIKTLL